MSNFRAFENAITIDFSATANYEFNKEAVKDGIVKTGIMYGKNASGKSSLGLAIFDIVANLTDNFVNHGNYVNYSNRKTKDLRVTFEYKFEFDNIEIIYSYSKVDIRTIMSEKLSIGGRTLIEYDKTVNEDSIIIAFTGAEHVNIELRKLNFSALKFIKSNVILAENEENATFNKFYTFINKMLLFWSLETREFIGYTPVSGSPILDTIIKRNHFADLQKFFQEAGFEDELAHSLINGSEKLLIKYSENESIDFGLACSSGMSSLLLLYYWLEDVSDPEFCPSFIFIDEFDAFYHYELSYFIIEKLKSYNCQVLLTTHNTSIFTNDLLRPDCYFICSKDKIENAHNATVKELRFGHNLEKLYRGGTFSK
ncbi:MAG: AAA family ATPase [Treponema sp.]|nr:AAA family ATPase [Treponema sp.]